MSDGEEVGAEVPAASPPAESAPEVVSASSSEVAPVTEPEPVPLPEIEIPVEPETPEASPAPVSDSTPASPQPEPPPVSDSAPTPPPTPAPTEKAAVSSAATPAASQPATPATPPIPDTSIRSRLGEALEAIRFRKRARLDKILQLAAKKRKIKNDDVEKLLRVSDSTAQRYLNQLVVEAKLRRVGHAKQPTYEPL